MSDKDQIQTPFFAAAKAYAVSGILPMHMPGHKRGAGAPAAWRDFVGLNVLSIDSTEVEALDDLHHPVASLKAAQALAAKLHGADNSFFLVNGTTCGIQAMILAACNPGDKIIIPRNAHRSILSGIIMAGAQPIYVQPEISTEFGIPMGITLNSLTDALDEHPDTKAVLVINPTYYGAAADMQGIVELAHRRGIPVLVDEAHGPHLQFHPELPIAAMAAGADAAAQSYHKILGSLTQSSMLHIKSGMIDIDRLRAALQLVQTTSPSQILLCGLDTARQQIATEGYARLAKTIALAELARSRINAIMGLQCLGREHCGSAGFAALDPTKLTVSVKGIGLTGYAAEQILRSEFKIEIELADMQNVLMMITLADTQADIERLVAGFKDLAAKYGNMQKIANLQAIGSLISEQPKQRLLPREAFFAQTKKVDLQCADGLISAEFVIPYPPGVPILVPGEEISTEMIAAISELIAAGASIQGPADMQLRKIRVIDKK